MSYGWLTQSSILPKQSKKISVDNSSVLDLKVLISQKVKEKKTIKKKVKKSNPGIQSRIQKDCLCSLQFEKTNDHQQKIMKKKALLYQKLEKKAANFNQLLVDFRDKKKINIEQKQREQFYNEKLQEIKHEGKYEDQQLANKLQYNERQRRQWQKEIIQQLGNFKQQRVLVQQQYDKKLHSDEKQELKCIIVEESQKKKQIVDLKRKREELITQRKEKLKKLNII